jgi:hypothetical protein
MDAILPRELYLSMDITTFNLPSKRMAGLLNLSSWSRMKGVSSLDVVRQMIKVLF